MSWDIVLFNSAEKISDPAEIDEAKLMPTSFNYVFEHHFKKIVKKTRPVR